MAGSAWGAAHIDRAGQSAAQHLVQRNTRQSQLHHSRGCGGHSGAGGRAADLTHRLARVGARHHGATHFHARHRAGGHARQAVAVLRGRHGGCGGLSRPRGVLVRGANARQFGHAVCRHGAFQHGDSWDWLPDFRAHPQPARRQPDCAAGDHAAHHAAVGVHLSD